MRTEKDAVSADKYPFAALQEVPRASGKSSCFGVWNYLVKLSKDFRHRVVPQTSGFERNNSRPLWRGSRLKRSLSSEIVVDSCWHRVAETNAVVCRR